MVAGISFVGASQAQAEMLLAFGALLRLGFLCDAEIVDPEDAALAFLECSRRRIRGGREQVAHEFRHGPHLQRLAFWKRDDLCRAKCVRYAFGFALINSEQIVSRVPLR